MTQRRLPDRVRLPFEFDPLLLVRDLQSLVGVDWIRHFVPQNYEGEWSVIPLRGKAGARHPVTMIYSDPTATTFENTPMLKGCAYFREVLEAFACPLRSVRLMRLGPGSTIKEHTDLDLSAEGETARIHVPITTNPGVEFYLNGSRVVLEAGTAWYLRLSDPHRVHNKSESDRVHMVIDATVNDWLRDLIELVARQRA
jgi:hypothetical protein